MSFSAANLKTIKRIDTKICTADDNQPGTGRIIFLLNLNEYFAEK